MRPDLRVISAALEIRDYDEAERVRHELGFSRSDLVREALRQFVAVHDFKRYNADTVPDLEGVIADADARTEGSPYDETLSEEENRPRTYSGRSNRNDEEGSDFEGEDAYFERFCEEQGIDDEYIVEAVRRARGKGAKE